MIIKNNKFIFILIIIQHYTFSVNCFRSFFTDFRLTESEISPIMRKGDIMIDKLSFYITDCHDPYTNLAMEKHLLECVGNNEIMGVLEFELMSDSEVPIFLSQRCLGSTPPWDKVSPLNL